MTGDTGSEKRDLLRHAVATLAYRAEKALRDTPASFAGLRLSPSSRSALEIVSHLGDLMEWGERMALGQYHWEARPAAEWEAACERFFRSVKALDEAIVQASFDEYPAEMIFQGPIADALTHVGQLSIMRGVAGAAVRPESYARAEIQAGRVGREQSTVRKEFDGDASRAKPRPPAPSPDPVTEASEQSFPASDPPANTPVAGSQIEPGKPEGSSSSDVR
jgi:hypothetical protein